MKIKIEQYQYNGESYSELLKAILHKEPKISSDNQNCLITKIKLHIQRELYTEELPIYPLTQDYVNKDINNEIHAKRIWKNVFYFYPELKLQEAIPLKSWYKVFFTDENGNTEYEFIKEISDIDALLTYQIIKDCEEGDYFVEYLSIKEEKQLAEKDEINKFIIDHCTEAEAKKYIKNGSFSILAAEWNTWAKENNYANEVGIISLDNIRNNNIDGLSIVTADDGAEYVLVYVL